MEMAEPYRIEAIPLFSSLPAVELATLNDAASRRLYRGGETIFDHCELPEYLYVVEQGIVASAHYVDVRESMRNGGGPACLRLRVQLNDEELAATHQGVLFEDVLHAKLTDAIHGRPAGRCLIQSIAASTTNVARKRRAAGSVGGTCSTEPSS